MGLPRTFVSFSGTDIHCYRLMQAWKNNQNIDFNFIDLQLPQEINSDCENYIKKRCSERIDQAGYFIQLIGEDTKYKYKYVRWEAEVAFEKSCTVIGVNLDQGRQMNENKTPLILKNKGAIFVSFTPKIIQYALQNYKMEQSGNYYYPDNTYTTLGIK